MGSYLLARTGPLAEARFPLPATTTTLGADPLNDITWADQQLAPEHARIRWEATGEYTLVDLGSVSGTFVNGQRIANEHSLHPGDRIRVAGVTFVYLVLEDQAAPPSRRPIKADSDKPSRGNLLLMLLVLFAAFALLASFAFLILPSLWSFLLLGRPTETPPLSPPQPSPTLLQLTVTALPDTTSRFYPVPILIGPADDFAAPQVVLQWSWRGALDRDEWYEVSVWSGNSPPRSLAWVKIPQIEVGIGLLAPGYYNWQVVVVQGAAPGQKQRDLSAPSESRRFALLAPSATPTLRPTVTATPSPTATPTFTPIPFVWLIISGTIYDAQRGIVSPLPNAEVRIYIGEYRLIARTDSLGKYVAEFRLPGVVVGRRADILVTSAGYEAGVGDLALGAYPPNIAQYLHLDLGLVPIFTPTPTATLTATVTITPQPTFTPTPTFTATPTATSTPTSAPTSTSMPTTKTPAP
jgi:pSer/pThr/pTyr-binding forkhead associated (FHA) protein